MSKVSDVVMFEAGIESWIVERYTLLPYIVCGLALYAARALAHSCTTAGVQAEELWWGGVIVAGWLYLWVGLVAGCDYVGCALRSCRIVLRLQA
jgi:hypothetical protein